MDCTGCLWLHDELGQLYCVMRDGMKLEEDELKFPKNPNWGCDKKTRVAVNSEGTELVIVGAQGFVPLPGGYNWES